MAKIKYGIKEINEKIKKTHSEITVIGMPYPSVVECHCDVCNQNYMQAKYNTMNGKGCPICTGHMVITGVNDIKTTAPDIARWYVDDSFVSSHTKNSNQKGLTRCPDCGYEMMKSPNLISKSGFVCPRCGDGVSYPNKFVRALLSLLPIDEIDYEYMISYENNYYFYDNHFVYDNKDYLVEVDGGFHYPDSRKNNKMFLQIANDTQLKDKIKDKLAKDSSMMLIRIDARLSEIGYLKNSIMNSQLSDLFDLTSIDWEYCDKEALSSDVVKACKLYNQGNGILDISRVLGRSIGAIRAYLQRGANVGICNYVLGKKLQNTVYVYDQNNELLFEAENLPSAARNLSVMYPDMYFSAESIMVSMRNNKRYKGFYFINKSRLKKGQVNLALQ